MQFLGALFVLFVVFSFGAALPVNAHELHGPNGRHVDYRDWVSRDGKGCCNNQDCHPVSDTEVDRAATASPSGVAVKIEGRWCPVGRGHFLKSGNAPQWDSAHVCVKLSAATLEEAMDPCKRLLCFQDQASY